MPRTPPAPEVPLLLAGIPARVEDWLRTAGLSVAPFRDGGELETSVRRRSGQIVLFDSRSASSRCDARIAQDLRLETINVAPLLDGWRATESLPLLSSPQSRRLSRGMFFDRLKEAVEAVGGLWLRVSEYPFPYQAALLVDGDPADGPLAPFADAFAPVPATHDDPLAWLQRRYESGLPAWTPDGELGFELPPRDFPLLWRTTTGELLRWWHVRQQITLSVRRDGGAYHLEARFSAGRHRPTLELWRHNHVASIPLAAGNARVSLDGLFFQQEHDRHPAGFAARWKEETAGCETHPLYEPQAS